MHNAKVYKALSELLNAGSFWKQKGQLHLSEVLLTAIHRCAAGLTLEDRHNGQRGTRKIQIAGIKREPGFPRHMETENRLQISISL